MDISRMRNKKVFCGHPKCDQAVAVVDGSFLIVRHGDESGNPHITKINLLKLAREILSD